MKVLKKVNRSFPETADYSCTTYQPYQSNFSSFGLYHWGSIDIGMGHGISFICTRNPNRFNPEYYSYTFNLAVSAPNQVSSHSVHEVNVEYDAKLPCGGGSATIIIPQFAITQHLLVPYYEDCGKTEERLLSRNIPRIAKNYTS